MRSVRSSNKATNCAFPDSHLCSAASGPQGHDLMAISSVSSSAASNITDDFVKNSVSVLILIVSRQETAHFSFLDKTRNMTTSNHVHRHLSFLPAFRFGRFFCPRIATPGLLLFLILLLFFSGNMTHLSSSNNKVRPIQRSKSPV